ncbi:MAG: hypothetical protein LBU43_11445 [Candidatus Accumulibacter sp.]|nr:hypothetical protein [Accumulibacter sp.]
MGFDVSYHPISESEIKEWYFDALEDDKVIDVLAARYGIKDFYRDKYRSTISIGRGTKPDESFDKSHAFYAAVVQGFFRTYFYIRGGAYSFVIEENPDHVRYTKPWTEILGREIMQPVKNRIVENYCGGVYIPVDQVSRLLSDIDSDAGIRAYLENGVFGAGTLEIFLKALRHAQSGGFGLLEATEVVEPNPLNLNRSKSYSNLFNCDREGPQRYAGIAARQIAEAMAQPQSKAKEVKTGGFFSNLFQKKKR